MARDKRRMLIAGGAVAFVVVAAVLALTRSSSAASAPRAIPWSQLGALQTGPPPWNNGAGRLTGRLAPLGLHALGAEGTVLHIHQHLDLYVNRKRVTLPALIGIYDNSYITEVHVHDTTGVIHIESPTRRTFTLGQLFGEWGVKLTASCVGRYCGHVKWWVNGKRMTGDPAALRLKPHQEIAIAAGRPPLVVPRSYAFPQGE
ncbi:MAG TPA: hypothetical protein VIL98_01250 [Gaiellaceae bacterium]